MSHAWVSGAPAPLPCTAPPRPRRSGSFSSRHGGGPRRRRRRSPRATHAADAVRKRAGLGRGECPGAWPRLDGSAGFSFLCGCGALEPSPTLDRSPGHRRPCQLQTPWSLGSSKPPGNTLPTDAFTRHEHHGLSGAPRCAWVCSPRPRLRLATPPPLPPPKAHGRDIGTGPRPRGLLCVPLGRDTLSGTRARPPHGGSARQVPERLVCRTWPCHRDKQPRVSVASCDNVTCLPSGLLLVVQQTHRTSARAPRALATRAVPS